MRVIQFIWQTKRMVGVLDNEGKYVYEVENAEYLYDLVIEAINLNKTLNTLIKERITDNFFEYELLLSENKVLVPVDHRDNARCVISGTGLTHLNSALLRDYMHDGFDALTDAQKIHAENLKNGKPKDQVIGSRPEWFYKGSGHYLRSTGQDLTIPYHLLSGGDEAELVAIYVSSPRDGTPFRVGFTLGNEFSDHELEKENHYYLAQSKLMPCSVGPELLLDDIQKNVIGTIKIIRKGEIIWQDEFHTGEENMTQSLSNIEYYLFQKELFRQAGNVYYHFLGADKTSFSDQLKLDDNDIVEINSNIFKKPLINKIKRIISDGYQIANKLYG